MTSGISRLPHLLLRDHAELLAEDGYERSTDVVRALHDGRGQEADSVHTQCSEGRHRSRAPRDRKTYITPPLPHPSIHLATNIDLVSINHTLSCSHIWLPSVLLLLHHYPKLSPYAHDYCSCLSIYCPPTNRYLRSPARFSLFLSALHYVCTCTVDRLHLLTASACFLLMFSAYISGHGLLSRMLRLNTSLFRNSLTSLWDDGVSTPWAAFALIQHENGDSRGSWAGTTCCVFVDTG